MITQLLKGPLHAGEAESWVCDSGDHTKTPVEAYRDLKPLLQLIAQQRGLNAADMRIYDPYYCNGRVVGAPVESSSVDRWF